MEKLLINTIEKNIFFLYNKIKKRKGEKNGETKEICIKFGNYCICSGSSSCNNFAIIAIAVTILLLSYNDYQISVIGDYTFVIMKDDELEKHGYPEGALVLVKETKAKNINEGDHIFLYRTISTSQFEIKYAQVILKDTSGGEYATQYILDGNAIVDHEDVIGTTKDIKVIPHLGTILSILQSRYGYLFLIVVVSFIAFLYEIYELIMEIKYGDRPASANARLAPFSRSVEL